MRRSILCGVVAAVIGVGLSVAIDSRSVFAVEEDARQADHAFVKALGASDKTALGPLLDADLVWVDAEGTTRNRTQILEHVPTSTLSEAGSASYDYGQVVTVRTNSGKLYALRVWAKRPSGWRLLAYHEVKQLEKPGTGTPAPPVKECINPCKTVPYQPRNEAEAGVISSWQALETAVTNGDASAWAPHFMDEFVVIRSSGTEPETKKDRIANLMAQKKAGTNGAPAQLAPDHTRLFTIGESVVMSCQTLPHRGKPSQVTRVWTRKGGMWLMTVSFQTAIQAAAPVADR